MAELRDMALKSKKPFDYDPEIDGIRALDRYTLQFKLADPHPRFLHLLALGDLYGALAREVVEAYGDDIPAHPVGTGPFHLAEWRRSSRIVLERNPTFREMLYDAEPNADDVEGQALLQRFRGRRLPMIDRVEISIIEEQQPRWLSFLNKQQDLLDRIAIDFVNTCCAQRQVRAVSRKAERAVVSRACVGYHAVVSSTWSILLLGGYTPDKVALRRAIGLVDSTLTRRSALFWRGQAVPAHSGLMPNIVGYDH